MVALVWDEIGSRTYESGLDRGVLYLPDGSVIPWNGLVEVEESSDNESTSVYFDGMKISHLVTLGGFQGSIKAITYPDEFLELEGMGHVTSGMMLGQQSPKAFGLSYRSRVGNDLDGDSGYKIHILYNVFAVPNDKTFATITDDPDINTFDWAIEAIPEEVEGFKPTAHISIDSRLLAPDLLADIEERLYGSASLAPSLIPLSDFVNYLYFEYVWKIVDNGDGTWTAITPIEGLIAYDDIDPDKFTLFDTNETYLTPEIFIIEDSMA